VTDVADASKGTPSMATQNGRDSRLLPVELEGVKPGMNLDSNGRSVCTEAQTMPELSSPSDQRVNSTLSQVGSSVTVTMRR